MIYLKILSTIIFVLQKIKQKINYKNYDLANIYTNIIKWYFSNCKKDFVLKGKKKKTNWKNLENKNRAKYFNGNYIWIYIYYLVNFNKYVIFYLKQLINLIWYVI